MSSNAVAMPNARNLPALPIRDAERMGAKILAALDRLGFTHVNQDGRTFGVCFSQAHLWGEEFVSYTIDSERLWHFSVADLCTHKVIAQLRAVTGRNVWALAKTGLTYVVELAPRQAAARLPNSATLDLGTRPAGELLVPVGIGHNGPQWRSLAELGHCLIAGATGAGKSSWMHAALAALLTGNSPEKLKIALVDPKRSELTPWANAPHLLAPIAHSIEQATRLLANVVSELDRRGELFSSAVCRDITSYNRQAVAPLPYILIVIDECLDVALSAGERSTLTNYLKTLAIRGRGAGIFLWAATQHAAAVAGLPRVVNVNLATRLCFRVADQSAAHAAGCVGAERIPRDRPGRLLAKVDGAPVVLQSYYVPEETLGKLVRGLSNAPSGPQLTEREIELVRYAVTHMGGAFIKNKLAVAFADKGWTDYALKMLAATWERRGWLTAPAHRADPRRVTPELLALAGLEKSNN
jgi:hypothetical protein